MRPSRTSLGVGLALLLVAAAVPADAQETSDVGWSRAPLDQPTSVADAAAMAVGVAVGADLMVAVGQRTCRAPTGEAGRSRCWGQAWTSSDGIAWTTVEPTGSGLDLGISLPVLSGPEVGVGGVAFGPAGFVAFGRVGARKGGQSTAVWGSQDGRTWERLTGRGEFPRGTRLRTILGADDGYLLGGVIYGRRAPRAAIWSSADGRSWTLAKGREAFGIGGYVDTMEDPGSGGIDAFTLYPAPAGAPATLSGGAVAVGQSCLSPADRSVFAWNGFCWGETWRSEDGSSWRHGGGGAQTRGASSVAAVGARILRDAPICYGECPSAVLVSDDATTWSVAYGSPVDGVLLTISAVDGRFAAMVASPEPDSGLSTLKLWLSDDGADWRLASAQPMLPADAMSFHHVAATAAGDQLLVVASGETAPDGDIASVAFVSPPVATLG